MSDRSVTAKHQFRLERDKAFYLQVAAIMIPIALQQAVNMGVNMMDTIMLTSLGDTQLSASSLANMFYNLYLTLCMGLVGGCNVLAAQYWGKGNPEKVKEAFSLALRILLLLSAVFIAVTALFPAQIMRLYTPEPDVIRYGAVYLRITALVYLPHGIATVMTMLLRAIQDAKIGLYVSIVSFFANVFFNWVFIFGKLGAPRLEIAGAAIGTLIARLVELAVTLAYLFAVEKKLRLKPMDFVREPSKEMWANYRRLGVNTVISDGLAGLGVNVTSMILGHLGSAVVSANAVCQVVDRLFTVVIMGISNASGVIVGNTVGRGEKERALNQGWTFYWLSFVVGVVCAVLVAVFGTMSLGIYDKLDAETIEIAKTIMLVYAFCGIFLSISNIMCKGVLRGGGDTKVLMFGDVIFLWVLGIPLGYLAGMVLHAPYWLTILCIRSEIIAKTVWSFYRLKSCKWLHETKTIDEIMRERG